MTITSCSGGPKMNQQKNILPLLKDVPTEYWQKLSQKKIYFGHQSVGFNIIDGIKDIMKNNSHIKLNIIETMKPDEINSPTFAHSPLGQNMNPKAKCDAFVDLFNVGMGNKVDIAFFKFCYVDIMPGTDINTIFSEYKKIMSDLRSKYPQITFIHLTTPLTAFQTGPKALIKKIINRPIDGYDDNIKREQFNAMLRKEYNNKEPVFDLAAIESTNPDGSRLSFSQNGLTGYALVPEYTNDGGHLNEKGRKVVAEQLLILLANIASR